MTSSNGNIFHVMPQSHPTTDPVQFLAPVPFLICKAEWSAYRNFMPVLFSWSHQAMGPVRFDTAVHLWCDPIICWTPHGPRVMPVRAWYGPRTGISNVFHILRCPCGTRNGAIPHLYIHLRQLTQPEFIKILQGHFLWPYRAHTGPLQLPHGLFTGCLRSLDLYGACKHIMHALKLYETVREAKFFVWGPYRPREWTYNFCLKQPGNSPGTAHTGPGSVMWLRHYWPFVRGIHWSQVNSPHKGQWCKALMFSLRYLDICKYWCIKRSENNEKRCIPLCHTNCQMKPISKLWTNTQEASG